MNILTPIATQEGMAYIDAASVVLISQPMTKPKQPTVRRVGLGNGLYVLALNTPANLRILGLVDEAETLERLQAKPTRTKRPRKAARTSGAAQ